MARLAIFPTVSTKVSLPRFLEHSTCPGIFGGRRYDNAPVVPSSRTQVVALDVDRYSGYAQTIQ